MVIMAVSTITSAVLFRGMRSLIRQRPRRCDKRLWGGGKVGDVKDVDTRIQRKRSERMTEIM
jgi:hypothetical protein